MIRWRRTLLTHAALLALAVPLVVFQYVVIENGPDWLAWPAEFVFFASGLLLSYAITGRECVWLFVAGPFVASFSTLVAVYHLARIQLRARSDG
jgi:hypothetical protein